MLNADKTVSHIDGRTALYGRDITILRL